MQKHYFHFQFKSTITLFLYYHLFFKYILFQLENSLNGYTRNDNYYQVQNPLLMSIQFYLTLAES